MNAVIIYRKLDGTYMAGEILERFVEIAKRSMRSQGMSVVAVIRPKRRNLKTLSRSLTTND